MPHCVRFLAACAGNLILKLVSYASLIVLYFISSFIFASNLDQKDHMQIKTNENMLLVKLAFLVVLVQFGLALSYFEDKNDDVIGNIKSKKSYQSLIKKLHQFLEHDFNVERLLKQLSTNSSNTTNKCINQFVSMNKAQLISGKWYLCQLTFTCSKSTIEILEKEVKYVQR